MSFLVRIVFFSLIFGLIPVGKAQTVKLQTPIKTDKSIKIGKLPNGLQYYIKPNQYPKQRVELRLVVNAGSIDEDDDQQGLAHFVEHMAFNGTTLFKDNSLIDALRSMGLQFGADLNATTNFDHTIYMLPIPTDKKENLPLGIKILADWASGIRMEDAAIESERKVLLEESRLRKGAGERLMHALRPHLFNHSKFAQRMPIGLDSVIQSAKPEVIRRFYQDWYRPNNMAVIVIGDISISAVEKLIIENFGTLKNQANQRKKKTEVILPFEKDLALALTDKEQTQNVMLFAYSPERYRIDRTLKDFRQGIIENLYEKMFNKRLRDKSESINPPFNAANIHDLRFLGNYANMSLLLSPGISGRRAAIDALMKEKKSISQFGFTADEFELAKTNIIANHDNSLKESGNTESKAFISACTDHFLYHFNITSTSQDIANWRQLLPTVRLAEINSYAKTAYQDTDHKLSIYVGNSADTESTPTEQELSDEVSEAEKLPAVAPEHKLHKKNPLNKKPSATSGTILSETYHAQSGTTEIHLSNGIKVLLKPTDFKKDEVLFSLQKFGGTSIFPVQDETAVKYANSFVVGMGLDTLTPIESNDLLAGKKISLSFSTSSYTDEIQGSSSTNDLEMALRLLYLRTARPREDNTLFVQHKKSTQEILKHNNTSPEVIFDDQANAIIFDHHPRTPSQPKSSDFDDLTMQKELEIYKQRNQNFNGASAAFIGNFSLAKIRPLLKSYLGALPSTKEPLQFRDHKLNPVRGIVKQEIFAGKEKQSVVRLIFSGDANYSREESSRFYAMIEILQIRLEKNIREKLGLVYSPNVSGSFERIPSAHYAVSLYLPCAPENIEQLVNAVFTEIDTLSQTATITDAAGEAAQLQFENELSGIKKNWLLSHQKSLTNNNDWLGEMNFALLHGGDLKQFIDAPKRIEILSTQQVQTTAKRYLDKNNYIQIVLKPENAESK
ncbi:MAG: insulinase family protein [Burkholderiales bacterium]|nr:insulinase family protein [Burkholderiales bacterium]